MASAVLKAQRDTGQLFVALHQCHPVLNRSTQIVLQYGCHALRWQRAVSYRVRKLPADSFPKDGDLDWFRKDFVSLHADGRQSLAYRGVAAEHQSDRLWVGVAHGAHDGKTITGAWHVQVGKQGVKVLCRDVRGRVAHVRYGDYLKAVPFQRCPQHIADSVIVLG